MPCTTIVFLSYFNDYIEINYSTIKDITSLRLCCTGGDFRVSNQSCGFWDLPVDCVWLWAVWEDDIWCSTKSRPGVEPRIVIAYKRGSIDGCVTSPHPSPGLRTSRCNSSLVTKEAENVSATLQFTSFFTGCTHLTYILPQGNFSMLMVY